MKKTLIALGVGLALTFTVKAADPQVFSLLTGSNVELADAQTVTNNAIGLVYTRPNGNKGYTFSYSNIVSGTVVVNSNAYVPAWATAAQIPPQATDMSSGNYTLQVACFATNSASTNPVTLVLERSGDGITYDERTTFTLLTTLASTSTNTVMTNMPASFFVGTRYVRIKTAASGTVAGALGVTSIARAAITGWTP